MFYNLTATCDECNAGYDAFDTDVSGIPIYYVGSPINPNEAEKYFCGPSCANNFYKRTYYEPIRQAQTTS